ncbi:MAG TPA: polyphenol oxidase family protein [Gemmatimonadaceae bacterium]|nr:polyphenol oxidase family protein [Gemmatimonadaceae bacterium]
MLQSELIDDFLPFGVRAFTTTRATGSFNTLTREPVDEVMGRWYALREALLSIAPRFATARQVHGATVVEHAGEWRGWLRVDAADGHFAPSRGTAMAVTVADCVPVFIAHPSGAAALLHSGWRGTAERIIEHGIAAFGARALRPSDLHIHLGPAICGRCYEVSPDVFARLTGRTVDRPTTVDLRALLADHARGAGVRDIAVSPFCTRCDNDRFYSHRAGDDGRQLGVLVAEG